ncbi:FkbM family methyltransferase [Neobacillus niacini]|uniref:FkbM family methyltransferase n=1 Tax=Neobacillus niacini TaxID=86668 RepID=UPI002859F5E4|nr:FkbM family methyltransferase [Neobacillus niacini]MDR7075902.1 FkbM family methyltransferase [Neobacillus niacini]
MNTRAAAGKTFLFKMWENYPRTWKFFIDLGILLKYKTLNTSKIPNEIVLPSSNSIFVNSEENRGRALLISNGMTQKRLTNFWMKAVKDYSPDLVIDVGVNYGECIFSTNYSNHTHIYGIEANQDLLKYIHLSKEVHPNKEQMKIFNVFAADKEEEKTFYVDKHWSGTSSAAYRPAHDMIEQITVNSVTIDSIVAEDVTNKNILFKVDVEGYEAFVLRGMTELIQKSASALGYIEFNSEYMEKSGVDLNDFLRFLQEHFLVYIYCKNELVNGSQLSLSDLYKLFGSNYVHTDMILVKNIKQQIDIFQLALAS